jgi:hypothetical protein
MLLMYIKLSLNLNQVELVYGGNLGRIYSENMENIVGFVTINEMAVRIKFIQIELLNLLNIHVLRAWNNDKRNFEYNIKLFKKDYIKNIILHMTTCERTTKYTSDQDIKETYKYYSNHCKPVNSRLLYEEISRSELCTDIQTSKVLCLAVGQIYLHFF